MLFPKGFNLGLHHRQVPPGDNPAYRYSRLDSIDNPKQGPRPWSSYIWDTWDKPPEEREFLNRLDACLTTYAALSYFSKYLDQKNVTNAYVSGMKEDLGLHDNQLNYITTSWTVGYIIGQIPSNMLITRIRPSLWIPTMELIWSCLTLCLAVSKNFSTLCAIRFLVGLAESTFYPAIQYVIGSWYKKEELGKRSCIFQTASAVGSMTSGILQAGVYNGLNGKGGLAGWKSKPSSVFTQEQLVIAQRRMDSAGRKPPAKFTKEKVLGFFSTWHIYTLFNNGNGGETSMIFWLESFNKPGHIVYTIGQINVYPFGIYSLEIVTALIYAWWSDAVVARWPPILFAGTWSIITYVVLAATPVYTHIARRWTFYYFTGCMGGLPGWIMAWVNELNSHDNEKRAFVIASCNMWSYVVQAWLPIVIFPQVEQPRAHTMRYCGVLKGNIATACINFAMIVMAMITLYFERRDQHRAELGGGEMTDDVMEDDAESVKSIELL
ncbi:MFS general substrate transporter [Lactifluus subvellereus]|nr:MFS general substrate transporter [Lactifluus subvellereus]